MLCEASVDLGLERGALGALGRGRFDGFAQFADFGDERGLLLYQLLIDGQFFIDLDLAALAGAGRVALLHGVLVGCE